MNEIEKLRDFDLAQQEGLLGVGEFNKGDPREPWEKPWWQSRAMWGGVISTLSGVAGLFGLVLSPEVQELLLIGLVSLASGIGGVLAAYGRKNANTVIRRGIK